MNGKILEKLIFLLLIPSVLLLSGFRQLEPPEDSLSDSGSRAPQSFGSAADDTLERDWTEERATKEHVRAGKEVLPEQAERYGVQEFSIIATENGFFPNKIIVRRNIPVNLYLTSVNSQNSCFVMKSDELDFHRGIGAKKVEKISFRPERVGPVKFHCPVGNIQGILIVRD